jgi:hypothetical protein
MWCTEEGMPIHGKLVFTYYSGEGRNKSGCVPDVFLRQALCAMTVIDEDAAIRDEDAEVPLDDDGKRRERESACARDRCDDPSGALANGWRGMHMCLSVCVL